MSIAEFQNLPEGNLARVEESQVVPYLNRLGSRLSHLSEILQQEGYEYVNPYLAIVVNSIESMALKYQIKGDDKIDFSLTIALNSGFPTVKDFYLIEKNKAAAKDVLGQIPPRKEIIGNIGKAILRGDSPVTWQTVLRRYNFYERLSEGKVLEEYHLNEPKLVREENGRRVYTLEWSCIERGTGIPVFYVLCFTQDGKCPPLEKEPNDRLKTIIYQTQFGMLNLKMLGITIDQQIEEIHPKLLKLYRIGPYHDSITPNSEELTAILKEEKSSSVLKFTVESVMSEKVQRYGNWLDRITGKKTERELFSFIDSEMKMIVPFRVKQKLQNRDEHGNPCRVYGVTKGGEIV